MGEEVGRTRIVLSRTRTTTLFEVEEGIMGNSNCTYGVTITCVAARKGSSMHRSGTFCRSNGRPIYQNIVRRRNYD